MASQESLETATLSTTKTPSIPDVPKRKWWYRLRMFLALSLPVFVETVDYTVVATAQTQIASEFNALDLQSYLGTAFVLASAVFLPIWASVADVFGRHWAMQFSFVFFTVGSAVSTGSGDMPTMLLGRGIAGVGAGGLLTIVNIIVWDTISYGDTLVHVAMLVILYGVAYSVGPLIGGVLVVHSFRWIFAINLPIGVLGMILVFLLIRNDVKGPQPPRRQADSLPSSVEPPKETISQKLARLDLIGAALFVSAGIPTLLALNWGSTASWSAPRVIICLIIGTLFAVGFIAWEYVIEHSDDAEHRLHRIAPRFVLVTDPMIPLGMFKNYDVFATSFGLFVVGAIMLVIFYQLSIYYVVVSGLPASTAGAQMTLFAPGLGAGSILSVFMCRYLKQPKYCIIPGMTITAVALGLISMALETNNEDQLRGFMIMCGIGVGLTFGTLSLQARYCQPESVIAILTAMGLFFRTLGGCIGLAQVAAVMDTKLRQAILDALTAGGLGSAAAQDAFSFVEEMFAHSDNPAESVMDHLSPEVVTLVREGFRYGVKWAFLSLVPWVAIALVLSLFLTPPKFVRTRPNQNAEKGCS